MRLLIFIIFLYASIGIALLSPGFSDYHMFLLEAFKFEFNLSLLAIFLAPIVIHFFLFRKSIANRLDEFYSFIFLYGIIAGMFCFMVSWGDMRPIYGGTGILYISTCLYSCLALCIITKAVLLLKNRYLENA